MTGFTAGCVGSDVESGQELGGLSGLGELQGFNFEDDFGHMQT